MTLFNFSKWAMYSSVLCLALLTAAAIIDNLFLGELFRPLLGAVAKIALCIFGTGIVLGLTWAACVRFWPGNKWLGG